MFKNLFNKSKASVPDLNYLPTYSNKDKYFVRLKPWDWLNSKQIFVASKIDDKPAMITMDFWPQEIYLDADGQLTVSELINLAVKQYQDSKMEIPENLDKFIIEELERLVNESELVEFRDEKTILSVELALPMSQQLK